MQCTSPIYLSNRGIMVPCGKCRACRIARSREWSTRMVHEAEYWKESVFTTLTFDPEHLPHNSELDKKTLQLFLKRLRQGIGDRKMKYFACGEYGDQFGRPHYHLILFGIGKCDQCRVCSKWHRGRGIPPKKGTDCENLEKAWGQGYVDSRGVGWESTRYVADYVQKDTRKEAWNNRTPPFATMSQGIGLQWVRDNAAKLKKELRLTYRGTPTTMPRYYTAKLAQDLGKLEKIFKFVAAQIQTRRTIEKQIQRQDFWEKRGKNKWERAILRGNVNKQNHLNQQARDRIKESKL